MSLDVRTRCLARVALLAALAACPPAEARAQGYAIAWSSLDAGGAVASAGGGFSLGGTLAQPDAGTLAGGGFTLQGGFWAAAAAPTTDVPAAGGAFATDRLSMPRPNPFGRTTEVAFTLAEDGPVRLDVYDLAGQRVRTLLDGRQGAGTYRVNWDGADGDGRRLAAGVYFFQFQGHTRRTTQRVVLLR